MLAAIDASARRLGLSRAAYLRRALVMERAGGEVCVEDLERFANTFSDLLDDHVMDQAWE